MLRWLLLISALLFGWGGKAVAQTWPSKPIHAIIAFAAGSATDIIPRVVFEPLSAQLGQPIVVENRGGGGTTIAAAMVAKAEPDGYTLLATSSAHTLVPTVYPNASYDTAADFVAVVTLGTSPNVLVVSPSKGFKTAQDLVAAAKARPGSFNFASAGVGSATHLSAERFRMAAGFEPRIFRFEAVPKRSRRSCPGAPSFISVRLAQRCRRSARASLWRSR